MTRRKNEVEIGVGGKKPINPIETTANPNLAHIAVSHYPRAFPKA